MPNSKPHISPDAALALAYRMEQKIAPQERDDGWTDPDTGEWVSMPAKVRALIQPHDTEEMIAALRSLVEQLAIEEQERADFEASQARLLEQLEAAQAEAELKQIETHHANAKRQSIEEQLETARAALQQIDEMRTKPLAGVTGTIAFARACEIARAALYPASERGAVGSTGQWWDGHDGVFREGTPGTYRPVSNQDKRAT